VRRKSTPRSQRAQTARRIGTCRAPFVVVTNSPSAPVSNRDDVRLDLVVDRVALGQIASFASRDGIFMFGTDVGYIDQYDPTEEYRLLAEAGLTYDQVLASLTTNPARVWGNPAAGTLQVGNPGDVVLLADDPRADMRNFARVQFLVRGSRIVFSSSGK
jgi:imidazolonepropionase-like amidohydrolase